MARERDRMVRQRVRRAACFLIACGGMSGAQVRAQNVAEAWQPPVLTSERYDEDWSRMADPAVRAQHWTGQFKYIPLGEDAHLTTGAELRTRFEDTIAPVSGTGDDGYLWLRLLPYADFHVGRVRAFVEPVAAYAVGVRGGPGPTDATGIDLLQGFADVAIPLGTDTTLTFRAGRQQLALGTERLVGTRYGPNVPLAYDGGRAILHSASWRTTAFWLRPVESRSGNFDDRSSPTRMLWGVYASHRGGRNFEFYYLGFRNRNARYARGTGVEMRHTVGTRAFGTQGPWSWNAEAMGQFGSFADVAIRAWSVSLEGRHGWAKAPLAPAVTLRTSLISGDNARGHGTLGAFNAMFPKGKYFGELSPVGPRNLINIHAILTLAPAPRLTASLAALAYWRMRGTDGVYDVPGNLIGLPADGRGRFIGGQIESALSFRATQELTLSAAASVMRPGATLRALGRTHDIGLIGLEANFRF